MRDRIKHCYACGERKPFNGKVNYLEILKRDGHWCYLCETDVDPALKFPHPKSLVFEHVVPLIKGGEHSNGNIKVAHNFCNLSKGDR